MTTPKNVIRKFPPFAAFQKYLVSETSVGNISRQEVVSMIPPLVMDLQPGMTVLDMCAAPGSKAAQLLEMVHRGEEARIRKSIHDHAKEDGREMSPGLDVKVEDARELEIDSSDDGRATGLLIANDSDYKRAHMLIHQLKRLSSPNLIVTNHDATMYPSIKLPPTPENPANNRYLKFDRILADVPCSGDGTMRKNANLWQDWSPANALGLYITQVRILVRALQMLKVGGRVVYSTCSMNPVENEAVVASAIERCGGLEKVKLVPSDDKLPLLKRKPGLKTWSIMDKTGQVYDTFEEVQQDIAKNGSTAALEKLVEGMFSPSLAPGNEIPFERCMRVYAHQQDTGGFFIAILEKQSEFKAKPESDSKKIEPKPPISSLIDEIENGTKRKAEDLETEDNHAESVQENEGSGSEQPSPKKIKIAEWPKTTEGLESDPVLDAVSRNAKTDPKEGVGLTGENETADRPPPPGAQLDLYIRPGDMRSDSGATQPRSMNRPRNGQQFEEPFLYIAGDHAEVRTIESFYQLSPRFPRDRFMVRNASGEPHKTIYYTSALTRDILTENEGKGIKFIHGGVKMFMKQDVQVEGVCKWRIQSEGMPILEGYVAEGRVVRLYKKETLRKLLIEMFPKVGDGGSENLDEIGERVNNIGMGCCVLRIEPSNSPDGFEDRIVLPLWRSLHSLNLMLAKEDRTAMLLRIFNDTTPLVNNHKGMQKSEKVAPGFKVEDGETKVDTNSSIEAAGNVALPEPGNEGLVVKPGPYSTIVGDSNSAAAVHDVKMEKIVQGEDTGGPEQQLDGTGGIESQLGNVS
jgi:multisite-specific tRNA:(cytosine-C5)-methyltransferase